MRTSTRRAFAEPAAPRRRAGAGPARRAAQGRDRPLTQEAFASAGDNAFRICARSTAAGDHQVPLRAPNGSETLALQRNGTQAQLRSRQTAVPSTTHPAHATRCRRRCSWAAACTRLVLQRLRPGARAVRALRTLPAPRRAAGTRSRHAQPPDRAELHRPGLRRARQQQRGRRTAQVGWCPTTSTGSLDSGQAPHQHPAGAASGAMVSSGAELCGPAPWRSAGSAAPG